MNVSRKLLNQQTIQHTKLLRCVTFSTKPLAKENAGTTNAASTDKPTASNAANSGADARKTLIPSNYRFVYQEFLPDPKVQWRNATRERLERLDMLDRRKQIDIPEFYVGSVLAVTSSDPHAAGKVSRFVGICILRECCGLRAKFILRNVIDHQGIEINYDLYDPTIHKIEVLRLEKRVDQHLLYLRDALPEFSTFDLNMEPEPLEEGAEIPVNAMQVRLRPRPWLERWERQNLKGISNIDEYLTDKRRRTAKEHERPWEQFDLMKQYRSTIPEEEQKDIFAEIHTQLYQLELQRKRNKRKRSFVKPSQLA